ncbi:tRNA(fMet)-specific endonuclease VapC [bacterium HR16]|nr:tRNA(fMet)-specific endonuclease VapC [bacterium HR16]
MKNALVLDASVTLSWAFEDEVSAYADRVLESLSDMQAFVPAIWPLEVTNALLVAQRRGRLDDLRNERFLTLLQRLPITVSVISAKTVFDEVLRMARQYQLSTYDASYLQLAIQMGLPLATQDEPLRQAMQQCGVPIFLGEAILGRE